MLDVPVVPVVPVELVVPVVVPVEFALFEFPVLAVSLPPQAVQNMATVAKARRAKIRRIRVFPLVRLIDQIDLKGIADSGNCSTEYSGSAPGSSWPLISL
jgi:hypothetical protein